MLTTLLLSAGIVSGAALLSRLVWVRRLSGRGQPSTSSVPAATNELGIGAVVLYLDEEFWLAGRVVLTEDGEQVLRLFRTPGAEPVIWLGELGRRGEIVLFRETGDVPGGRLGDELPVGGRSLRLTRRGRAEMVGDGEQLPSMAEHCDFALLTDGSGRRLLVLDLSDGSRWALLGEQVNRELLDILPGASGPAPGAKEPDATKPSDQAAGRS